MNGLCKSGLLNKVKDSNLLYMRIRMNFVVKGVKNNHLHCNKGIQFLRLEKSLNRLPKM